MKNIFLFISLLLFTCPAFAQDRNLRLVKPPTQKPTNEKRKAVVIGMSEYGGNKRLDNTINDADDMADVFTRLGFEVTLLKNNDLQNLETNLSNWYRSIDGNDMAVFYFAGHGVEVSGENYLIPVGFKSDDVDPDKPEVGLRWLALNVNKVLDYMDAKRVNMKLLILDACRDNPFKRNWSRGSDRNGLAQMAAPIGTFIAFAAAPGTTAQDGGNYNLPNGVFTYYLKQEILKEGVSIDQIFTNVSRSVSGLTNNRQAPFRNSSLTETFYFIPASVVDIAELVRQADIYYSSMQYGKAVPLYKQAAESGDAKAQSRLGICYYNGRGITQDYNQAVEWFIKAAEQGEAKAQSNLGICCYNGQGREQDYNQAVEWYRKAAEQGEANAQTNLGVCYYNGRVVEQDYNQAVEWYRKAAEQGKANAQYNLGTCYEDGIGTAQDHNQAVYWYRKAADQGDADARKALKRLKVKYP